MVSAAGRNTLGARGVAAEELNGEDPCRSSRLPSSVSRADAAVNMHCAQATPTLLAKWTGKSRHWTRPPQHSRRREQAYSLLADCQAETQHHPLSETRGHGAHRQRSDSPGQSHSRVRVVGGFCPSGLGHRTRDGRDWSKGEALSQAPFGKRRAKWAQEGKRDPRGNRRPCDPLG